MTSSTDPAVLYHQQIVAIVAQMRAATGLDAHILSWDSHWWGPSIHHPGPLCIDGHKYRQRQRNRRRRNRR